MIIAFAVLFTSFLSLPTEYLYPVGAIGPRHLLILYQKNPYHIELWNWDPQTLYCSPALLSRYTPAGVCVLPNKQEFSFIDQGVIYIKDIRKRSPKTVELDAPLYNIELLNWLDNEWCYTHARRGDRFGIFKISREGEVVCLVQDDEYDCMYPQVVGEWLYYLKRSKTEQQLERCPYCNENSLGLPNRNFLNVYMAEKLISMPEAPYVFLLMESPRHGYMISHPPLIHKDDSGIAFSYWSLTHSDGIWHKSKLFDFTLPSCLLARGPDRLYESLLPLLPMHTNDSIYYADSDNGQISLRRYCKVSSSLQSYQLGLYLAPIKVEEQLFYGGFLHEASGFNGHTIRLDSLAL